MSLQRLLYFLSLNKSIHVKIKYVSDGEMSIELQEPFTFHRIVEDTFDLSKEIDPTKFLRYL
jgi:hypothetical protein